MEPIEWDFSTRHLATRIHTARKDRKCDYGRCTQNGTIKAGQDYVEILALDYRNRMQRDVYHANDDCTDMSWALWSAKATQERRRRERKLAKSNQ